MHILVVEDDVALARQIASALTETGHDPIVVHDGEKALDKTKGTSFDLVVLDIILPGMDGFRRSPALAGATSRESCADVDRTR
jgi:Response regulators consisting of a CheY-like receiver domain and a winged-helix DNA-binding domain